MKIIALESAEEIITNENVPEWMKTIIFVIFVIILLCIVIGIILRTYFEYNKSKKTDDKENQPMPSEKSNSTYNDASQEKIKLAQKYTSLFAEENKLKTEQIVITKQHGQYIEGNVTLTEQEIDGSATSCLTYYLKGQFVNKILTAEYYSKEGNLDERGAINLKMIDSQILSGFCSFSKLSSSDDEIRVSPYVWVEGEREDLINGTFDFCTQCFNNKKSCCCASEKVDMPVFLNSELSLIRNQLVNIAHEKNTFSKPLTAPFQNSQVRQMIRDEKKEKNGKLAYTKCHFFDIENQNCKIYNGRPIDCRLFPYDIKLSEDTKEYVIGYYTELCQRKLPSEATMKKRAHILRPYFFLLYPYLHIVTSNEVCERLNKADFKEIAKFQDFVF